MAPHPPNPWVHPCAVPISPWQAHEEIAEKKRELQAARVVRQHNEEYEVRGKLHSEAPWLMAVKLWHTALMLLMVMVMVMLMRRRR